MPSHDPATYVRDALGRTKSVYLCSCHGQSHPSRQIMLLHAREYKRRIARELQSMVREGSLGQNCWDRLPGETPQQFHRFTTYLQYRKIETVARVLGIEYATTKQNASKWQWTFRALAHDDHITRLEMEEFEAEKKRSVRRQAKLGQRLQHAAMAGAEQLMRRVQEGDVEVSGNEIAKLADVGVKIERLANMDPTAIKEDRGIHFIWEGARPSWAPAPVDEHPEPKQIEATLTSTGESVNG